MTNISTSQEEHLGVVELRIPAKAEWVAVARLAVAAAANRLAFSLEDIEDIKLALTEACANCCRHDAPSSGDAIDITFDVHVDALRITVRDHVRHAQAQDTARPIASQLREGRTESVGLAVIQALMDDVKHHMDDGAGTELVMVKRVQV